MRLITKAVIQSSRAVRRARDRQRGLRASPPPSPPSGPARASRSRRRARSSRATRRRRRAASRPRSARTTRPSSTPRTSGSSSHETADRRLVEVLTSEAPARDPLARGARRRVHARERRLPARPLRRRDAQATAPGRRPHRPRDHEGAARRGRGVGHRHALPEVARSPSSRRRENGWRARVRRARRSTPRRSSSRRAGAASASRRSAASSRRTIPARPAR